MMSRFRSLAVALVLLLPVAAQAQATSTTDRATAGRERGQARREAAVERRDAMRARREAQRDLTPEQRRAARAARGARIDAMPPEQQEYMRALTSYRQSLREQSRTLQAQVTAGTLTRDAMAHQLEAFRDANRPKRPAGMPAPERGDDS
jgi:hypothetical protein